MLKIVRRVSKNLDNDVCKNWPMLVEYCEYLYTLLDISSDVVVEVVRRGDIWDDSPIGNCSYRRDKTVISYYVHKRSCLTGMFIVLAHEFVHAEQNDKSFEGDRELDAEERSLEIASVWISGKVKPSVSFKIIRHECKLARTFMR